MLTGIIGVNKKSLNIEFRKGGTNHSSSYRGLMKIHQFKYHECRCFNSSASNLLNKHQNLEVWAGSSRACTTGYYELNSFKFSSSPHTSNSRGHFYCLRLPG